jgi:hypothetical protein
VGKAREKCGAILGDLLELSILFLKDAILPLKIIERSVAVIPLFVSQRIVLKLGDVLTRCITQNSFDFVDLRRRWKGAYIFPTAAATAFASLSIAALTVA